MYLPTGNPAQGVYVTVLCDIKLLSDLLYIMQLSTAALELGAIKMAIPERGAILLSQPIASCTLLMPPSIKSCNQFYSYPEMPHTLEDIHKKIPN